MIHQTITPQKNSYLGLASIMDLPSSCGCRGEETTLCFVLGVTKGRGYFLSSPGFPIFSPPPVQLPTAASAALSPPPAHSQTLSCPPLFSWYSASISMHCLRVVLSSSIKGRRLLTKKRKNNTKTRGTTKQRRRTDEIGVEGNTQRRKAPPKRQRQRETGRGGGGGGGNTHTNKEKHRG